VHQSELTEGATLKDLGGGTPMAAKGVKDLAYKKLVKGFRQSFAILKPDQRKMLSRYAESGESAQSVEREMQRFFWHRAIVCLCFSFPFLPSFSRSITGCLTWAL
jgi:hypothetical protein